MQKGDSLGLLLVEQGTVDTDDSGDFGMFLSCCKVFGCYESRGYPAGGASGASPVAFCELPGRIGQPFRSFTELNMLPNASPCPFFFLLHAVFFVPEHKKLRTSFEWRFGPPRLCILPANGSPPDDFGATMRKPKMWQESVIF